MEYIVLGQELTKEDLTKIHGGDQCKIFCSVDANCGLWDSCVHPTTYYGCTAGTLVKQNVVTPPKM